MTINVDLEKLYSPSVWSKRLQTPAAVENDHCQFAENGM